MVQNVIAFKTWTHFKQCIRIQSCLAIYPRNKTVWLVFIMSECIFCHSIEKYEHEIFRLLFKFIQLRHNIAHFISEFFFIIYLFCFVFTWNELIICDCFDFMLIFLKTKCRFSYEISEFYCTLFSKVHFIRNYFAVLFLVFQELISSEDSAQKFLIERN